MEPTFADFASTPFISNNIGIRSGPGPASAEGYHAVPPGGRLELSFQLPEQALPELTVTLAADGAPVLSVNGEPVGTRPDRAEPAGPEPSGSAPTSHQHLGRPALGERTATAAIPAALLRPGRNLLAVGPARTATRALRISRILIDPAARPGRSERARLADPDRDRFVPVRTRLRVFSTLRTPLDDTGEPRPGALWLALDDGTAPQLRTLSWRDAEGRRAAVGFGARMHRFQGHWVTADGRRFSYEGAAASPASLPTGPTPGCHAVFHRLADGRPGLDLRLDAGVPPLPVELAWTDTEGRTTAVLFDAGWDTFVGHTHRDGAPLGPYRGRRAPVLPGADAGGSGAGRPETDGDTHLPGAGAAFGRVRAEQVDFPALFASWSSNLGPGPRPGTPHQIQEVGDLVLPTGVLAVTDPGPDGWTADGALPPGRYPVAVAVEPLADAPQAGQHARVRMLAVALSTAPPVSWDKETRTGVNGSGLLCFGGRPATPSAGAAQAVGRLLEHARPVLAARRAAADGTGPDGPERSPSGRDPGAFAHGWHAVAQPDAGGVAVGVLVERAGPVADPGTGRVGRDAGGHPVAYVHHFPQG
ncbi:DUF4241 domain-containing protein [Kitasatospora sp. NBC_00240]|uniref:hypothetical protein n=1 Tax=Kitasatospora sp. NBC_00240 TaxID=2903567 RepID=UPI00225B5788|nr:hypothetical protein [Kitasatospora sp. NBC_00240]MCX5213174.1 DUF4241 domain-containing protein [Kitasatospora sp. NBC_00240]